MIIVKYNSNGDTLWNKIFDANGTDDFPTGFAKDDYGNLFVGGHSGASGSEDFTTLKYCNDTIDTSVTSINGDYLNCNQAGAIYQWYKDGVLLTGETNQGINLLPLDSGNYYCILQRYCCVDTTSIYDMKSVGVEGYANPNILPI